MTYTSAQANKLLKKLHDEHAALLDRENRSKDFRAAMGEDVESVRPAYDYADTQNRLEELEQKLNGPLPEKKSRENHYRISLNGKEYQLSIQVTES